MYIESSNKRRTLKRGGGLAASALSFVKRVIPVGTVVNRVIDALPVELHIPGGYQYCGPGTKLKKRLARGDPGINKLDEACKEHDIAYSKSVDSQSRSIADRVLAEKAWQRVTSGDASIGERTAALGVTAAMKAKTAIGGSYRCKKRKGGKRKTGGTIKRRGKKINPFNSRKKKLSTLWRVTKSGKGLYLRPYNAY